MGNCFGKQKKPKKTEITERKIEVNGRTLTERVEVSYRLSGNDEVQTKTVYRTVAVGEKEIRGIRYDEDGEEEGRVVSEHLYTGLNEAEAECFKEEWSKGWRPAPENLQKHQLKPRGAEVPHVHNKPNGRAETRGRRHHQEPAKPVPDQVELPEEIGSLPEKSPDEKAHKRKHKKEATEVEHAKESARKKAHARVQQKHVQEKKVHGRGKDHGKPLDKKHGKVEARERHHNEPHGRAEKKSDKRKEKEKRWAEKKREKSDKRKEKEKRRAEKKREKSDKRKEKKREEEMSEMSEDVLQTEMSYSEPGTSGQDYSEEPGTSRQDYRYYWYG